MRRRAKKVAPEFQPLEIACVLTALATLGAGPARAQPPEPGAQVLLIDPDPTLARAAERALAPWGVRVRALERAELGASMPGSAIQGRALAAAHDATVVVWISRSGDGVALWVYDRREDRVLARALANPPPFDAPTAAELALAIKALLRHTPAAPPDESLHETGARPPRSRPQLWLGLIGGARAWSTSPADVEARLGAQLLWWPDLFAGHLGLALRGISGPGVGFDGAAPGRWTGTEIAALAAGRLTLDALDACLWLGLGAQITTLESRLGERSAFEVRADALGLVELEVGARVGSSLRVALRLGAGIPFRAQTYYVATEPILAVAHAHGQVLAALEAGLF